MTKTFGSIAWKKEEDDLIRAYMTKRPPKPLSAAVKLGRTSDAILRRWEDLQSGTAKTKTDRPGRPWTPARLNAMLKGMEAAKARRGEV